MNADPRERYEDFHRMLFRLAPDADLFIRTHAAASLANLRNPPDVFLILADAIDEMRASTPMLPARSADLARLADMMRAEAPRRAGIGA